MRRVSFHVVYDLVGYFGMGVLLRVYTWCFPHICVFESDSVVLVRWIWIEFYAGRWSFSDGGGRKGCLRCLGMGFCLVLVSMWMEITNERSVRFMNECRL